MLFDSNTPLEINTTPFFKFNNNNKHSLDSAIKVILYFLKKISASRKSIIEEEIHQLFKNFEANDVINKIILNKIGYVKNS